MGECWDALWSWIKTKQEGQRPTWNSYQPYDYGFPVPTFRDIYKDEGGEG